MSARRMRAPTHWQRLVPAGALALLTEGSAVGVPGKVERNVAVLFVDIEGCTRLCEAMPAREMNDIIERYFSEYLDVIHRSGGEVIDVLGDGLLALFAGADRADNVRAAFAAALQIQARTRALNERRRHDPITVHIGLNAGRALVGFTRLRSRSGERWVYAATGPVTNVAARLCALATRGQILTTSATAAFLADRCHCRSLGSHSLKNVTGPVEVVEVGPAKAGAMWDRRRRRRRQND